MIGARTLAAEAYLLAYDEHHDLISPRAWQDYVVRGAELTELLAAGALVSAGGRVSVGDVDAPVDPLFTHDVADVERARTSTWAELLRHARPTYATVEHALMRDGVLARVAGRIVLREHAPARRTVAWTRARLLEPRPDAGESARLDAALVPLAAVVPMHTVASQEAWRAHAERVEWLTGRVDALVPGFADLVAQMRRGRGGPGVAG